ncbi:MAG: hypothetical protein GY861_14995 [bacterium]|nr:hypothetical protein [bacterium]
MKKYRKKPVIIEAIQWTGENIEEIRGITSGKSCEMHASSGGVVNIIIPTLEGDMIASPGDFIIRGIKGEYYPCKPDIFAATYETA